MQTTTNRKNTEMTLKEHEAIVEESKIWSTVLSKIGVLLDKHINDKDELMMLFFIRDWCVNAYRRIEEMKADKSALHFLLRMIQEKTWDSLSRLEGKIELLGK